MIIGHRGTNVGVVENTITAFKKAIEQGAQMIEFDVWKCASGEIVVFHDATFERLIGDVRSIKSLSLHEIEQLSLPIEEKIPTLRQVMDSVDRRVMLNIEVKDGEAFEGVGKLIQEYIVEKGWQESDFLVSSFDHFGLRYFMKRYFKIPTGVITSAALIDYGKYLINLNVDYAIVDVQHLSVSFCTTLKESGKKIIVYTVNDRNMLSKALELSVYAIVTDFPDFIRKEQASLLKGE